MRIRNDIRKRANRLFFIKVTINTLLIIIGAVCITLFLRNMQHRTSLSRQWQNSQLALKQVTSSLNQNSQTAEDLSSLFHDGNQDMLDDLQTILSNGGFDQLDSSSESERSAIFSDLAERADSDHLFLLLQDGRVYVSPSPEDSQKALTDLGLMSADTRDRLMIGTRTEDGGVAPLIEGEGSDRVYYYSLNTRYRNKAYTLVLGVRSGTRQLAFDSLADVEQILSRASVGNEGFMFAVNAEDGTFLFYKNGDEVLTGTDAFEAGLSRDALNPDYAGVETIRGTKYYCVSEVLEDGTVICAATETSKVFRNDRYVLNWTVASFLLIMFLCLVYTVIVRNDCIRNAVDTKKKIIYRWIGSPIIFDITIFQKVFPLMISGALLLFAISFYSQTLLEISQTARKAVVALDEVSERYEDAVETREKIQESHDDRYLSKALLIAYMLEEDPSVLNEPAEHEYSYLDEEGVRQYYSDEEGNRLRSVSFSPRLKELCEMNGLESIYLFNENGRTIATNTENWFFTLSRDPADQSYPFQQVLDGRKDILIQEMRESDMGDTVQYIGVAFHYYTSLDEQGNTVYLSRREYENSSDPGDLPAVTAHRSLLQIGLLNELTGLSSGETGSLFSSYAESDESFMLFDNSADHICLYSPFEGNIGMKAEDIGISGKAFSPNEYYGFSRVNGDVSFIYSRYGDGYHITMLIPRGEMYQSRTRIALMTSLTSMLLILFLSVTVTLTTEEEETLYATINDDTGNNSFVRSLIDMLSPYGHKASPSDISMRWNHRWIPWWKRTPEQKLSRLIDIFSIALVVYLAFTILSAKTLLPEYSIIRYIISGDWDRGFNIFAVSACVLVFIFVKIIVALIRYPLLSISSLLGTRSKTIGNLMISVVRYGGAIGAIFFCLYLVGANPTGLLASAGVLSLIIGFGAQSLIKDILAGIFFVFEGEFRIGDIVTVGNYRGTVTDIGLRTTKILAPDGNVKIYNNSEISGVLNMTKKNSFAFSKISIEYGQDIEYVEAVLRRDLPKLRKDNPNILADPKYLGINTLGDSGVEIAVVAECTEENIKGVTRYLNRELLKIFYRNNIGVPFPNVTVSTLNPEGRMTMADFKDTDLNISAWWEASRNQTISINVSSLGAGMDNALHVTEQLAEYKGLNRRSALHLRLLAEELFGMLRSIAGDVEAGYWVVVHDTLYELHMRTFLQMTMEIRERLLSVSTSGTNAAAKGFMNRLLDRIYVKLLLDADDPGSGENAREDMPQTEIPDEWTMSSYKSDIDSQRAEDAEAAEKWDELEASIVARLADEVRVSMHGGSVEIIIYKSFSEK